MSPQRAQVAQEASGVPAGVRNGVAGRAGAAPVPLPWAPVGPPRGAWAQRWAPHGQTDTEGLERVQSRAGAGAGAGAPAWGGGGVSLERRGLGGTRWLCNGLAGGCSRGGRSVLPRSQRQDKKKQPQAAPEEV